MSVEGELITQGDQNQDATSGLMPGYAGSAATTQAVQLAAAILDKRVATARSFPRSIARFKAEAISMLRLDIETARAAEYRKPVGKGHVTGPSIRLAELAALYWNNLEITISEPIVTERSVTVQAMAWDLERNYSAPGISTTSIIGKDGRRFAQHMIETTTLACASKARRNAIQAIIPKAFINELLKEAKRVADKHEKPLVEVRKDMLEYFARSYRVTADQVFDYLEVNSVDEVNLDHVATLRAVVTSIQEGEKIEAFFGPSSGLKRRASNELAAKAESAAARRGKEPKPAEPAKEAKPDEPTDPGQLFSTSPDASQL